MNGRCQCGLIRFQTPTDKPLKVYICHCLECQRQASSTYGVSLMFPAFKFPPEAASHMKTYTRTTSEGREKKCLFCENCGSRIVHYVEGQPYMTLKACVEGLTRELMDRAVHIWTKRAVVPIPQDAEVWEEEPDDGTGDKI